MKIAVIAGVVVLAMSVMPAFALGKKQNTTKQMSDQELVMNAAKANMAEIELGQLGERRASSDQVKAFAKRMVDDHQRALDSLKTVAKNEKIALPSALDPRDQAHNDQLQKLAGTAGIGVSVAVCGWQKPSAGKAAAFARVLLSPLM